MNVYNNMIVNNVSTHEGGGIAIDDAPNVRVFNNTIMKNLTTATAVTSNGQPAPAGLSTAANSDQLQATLPAGAPDVQQPAAVQQHLLGQPAGTRAGTTVIGHRGCRATRRPIDHWDLGVADGTGIAGADELGHPAERRRPPVHDQPDEQRRPTRTSSTPYDTVARLRAVADEPDLRRRDPGRPGPAAEAARRLPPDRRPARRPTTTALPARRSRPTSSRRRRLACADHRHRRPAAAGPGRVRHRRRRDPAAAGQPVDHEDRRRDVRPAGRVAHLHDRRRQCRAQRRAAAPRSPTPSRPP